MSNAQIVNLTIRGLGHCPSFKNNKSIYRSKEGLPFIATNAERKLWMQRATRLIESQLLSKFQTTGPETQTAADLQSWIASCVPLDDSWQWVRELNIKTVRVPKGQEGAEIEITQETQ